MGELPFAIDDPECDVLIRWASTEMQEYGLVVTRFLDDLVRRCFGLVDEVGIENIELRTNELGL